MPLNIPRTDFPALAELLNLPDSTAARLVDALRGEKPSLFPRTLSINIASKAGIERPKATKFVSIIIKTFVAYKKSGIPLEEFITELRETLSGSRIQGLIYSDSEWEKRESFLREILECEDPLGVTAKALHVMMDHAKTFRNARILTDLRPVFQSNPSDAPAAGIIIHTLKVEYRAAQEEREFFVALDSNDLARLETLIKRAKLKEKALKEAIRASDITILDV